MAFGVTAGFLGGVARRGAVAADERFRRPAGSAAADRPARLSPPQRRLPTAIVLSALGWSWGARVIRAQTLTLRSRDFVAAARETGERTWRLVLFEILPERGQPDRGRTSSGPFLYAILTSVALAFIGVANFSTWNLGTMLYWAQSRTRFNIGAWWWYAPPGHRRGPARHEPRAAELRPGRTRQPASA